MGFFSKLASIVLGSPESTLIKAKKEIQYAVDKAIHPELTNTLEQIISQGYEEVIPKILYMLGNSGRHHANVDQSTHERIKNHPLTEKLISVYGIEAYKNGFSFGYQHTIGAADEQFQKEIYMFIEELIQRLQHEGVLAFHSQLIAECYIISAREAFNIGTLAGRQLAEQEYIAVPKRK